MTDILIRGAEVADAPAIAALSGQLGYPATAEAILLRMNALAARKTWAVLVAVLEGAVAGWISVREDLSLETGPYAEIVGLVVDEARRGGGIGARLVHAAETWAKEHGHTRLRVRSNVVRERAHRFYDRLGYAVTKRQAVFDKTLT